MRRAKGLDDLATGYEKLAQGIQQPLLADKCCVQGFLKKAKSKGKHCPFLLAEVAMYIYMFDQSFKYYMTYIEALIAKYNPELLPNRLKSAPEYSALSGSFKKLDNAAIRDKQHIFKARSMLTEPKGNFHVQHEQTGKDVGKANFRYDGVALKPQKPGCYLCRFKGTLIKCINCPAHYHSVRSLHHPSVGV